MDFNPHACFQLTDRSFFNLVKRDIAKLAESCDFSEAEVGKVNIVVAEMASNLLKHTPLGGEILVKPLRQAGEVRGIEIICLDNGPGIANPQRMLEDGVSTHGSRGEGLGAIKRLADEFDFYSVKPSGTVLLARLYKNKLKPKINERGKFDLNAVVVAKPGETKCGDGWVAIEQGHVCGLLIADGLGHGVNAQLAADAAVASFQKHPLASPAHALRQIHADLIKTRGAVVMVATLHLPEQALTYCGVGNIGGRLLSAESPKSLISYNGIVGHNLPNTLHDQRLPWNHAQVLIFHSDGLKSRWDLAKHPHLLQHDTSVIAAVVYKEATRKTDDTLVVVGKTRS